MSKIEFHKNLKTELGKVFHLNDENLIKFIKDYVNDLNTLPPIDDAVNFILNNYKYPLRPITILRKSNLTYSQLPQLPNLDNIIFCIKTAGGLFLLCILYKIFK